MAASWLLLEYDVVNFRQLVNLDTRDVRLHIVVEPVLEVVTALPYLRHVKRRRLSGRPRGRRIPLRPVEGASDALTPCCTSPSSFLKQTTSPIPTCFAPRVRVAHVLRKAPYSHTPLHAPGLWRHPHLRCRRASWPNLPAYLCRGGCCPRSGERGHPRTTLEVRLSTTKSCLQVRQSPDSSQWVIPRTTQSLSLEVRR